MPWRGRGFWTASTLDKARQLFTELNVPYSIIGALVATAPGKIYTLKQAELKEMGVSFLATPVQQTSELAQVPTPPTQNPATIENSRAQGRALNTRGRDALHRGSHAEAVAYLEQAATVSPLDPEILSNLGFAYYKVRRYENADAALQIAARQMPKRAITWQNLGLVASARGQREAAITYFTRYLQMDRPGGPARAQLQQWSSDESLPSVQRDAATSALDATPADQKH